MVEHILNKTQLLAVIIKSHYSNTGIEFFTPGNFSQQLGYMNRPKGYNIEPHIHRIVERKVTLTQEVLYIKSGRIKVDFYDDDRTFLESKILEKGDVILLAAGGHGFEFLEQSEIIEIKQGPYLNDDDKIRFDPTK